MKSNASRKAAKEKYPELKLVLTKCCSSATGKLQTCRCDNCSYWPCEGYP